MTEQVSLVQYDQSLKAVSKSLLVLVVDSSGSMESLWGEVKSCVRHYIKDLRKAPGAEFALLTIVTFDEMAEVDLPPTIITKIERVELSTPSGHTRLYGTLVDVLKPINQLVDEARAAKQELPVMLALFTDGEDNHSPDSLPELRRLTGAARELGGIDLNLFGIGVDAKELARTIGFPEDSAISVAATAQGVRDASRSASMKSHITVASTIERK
jgi:uncharacterized protein YegL